MPSYKRNIPGFVNKHKLSENPKLDVTDGQSETNSPTEHLIADEQKYLMTSDKYKNSVGDNLTKNNAYEYLLSHPTHDFIFFC